MKQKIEWYREVLELEPGSRVFFPLAKLLAADGQLLEAVSTLQQGVLRHPDHVESRLLLVELLFLQDKREDAQTQIQNLGAMFKRYPGFWRAWSDDLARLPAMQDASMALRFFAAALSGTQLSWASVIEHGLRQVLGDPQGEDLGLQAGTPPSHEEEVSPVQEPALPVADPHETAALVAMREEAPLAPAMDAQGDEEPDEPEEAFSLRTRSMADILADQGDLAGALDIYQELIAADTTGDLPELHARVEELMSQLASPQGGGTGKLEEKETVPTGENNRLVSLLESLAQRLEARAR